MYGVGFIGEFQVMILIKLVFYMVNGIIIIVVGIDKIVNIMKISDIVDEVFIFVNDVIGFYDVDSFISVCDCGSGFVYCVED